QTRFRVQAPNSTPRVVKVIALDARSEQVVRRLADQPWNRASFFLASGELRSLTGQPANLDDEVATADLIVMVAAAGGEAEAAAAIGRACSLRRVMTTALIVESASAPEAALSRTLAHVRPWALMVVMADEDEYIEDMMRALRA